MTTTARPQEDGAVPGEEERLRAILEERSGFARHLVMRLVAWSKDSVVAEFEVGPDLTNRSDVMHGGAVMAFADNLGGTATFLNLAPGIRTTTIESKTNFFAGLPLGETARAECVPLHRGRTTMVWQTTFTRQDGKLAAMVTQTQLILAPR